VSRFERWILIGSAVLTGASGVIYAWMKYLLTSDDPYAVVHHPLQPLVLKIHIVAAPLLIFAVGLIFTQHVVKHWRSRRPSGKISGLAIGLTAAPMILSGYLIQTVTGEILLNWLIGTHLITGTLYLIGFAVHRGRMRNVQTRLRTVNSSDDREECA
jgi:hypothetical protein